MNQLVTDLSGQDNLNQPCSELTLLPPLCHRDDLLLVGPALHGTNPRYIEEQVTESQMLPGFWSNKQNWRTISCLVFSAPWQQCGRRFSGERLLQSVWEEQWSSCSSSSSHRSDCCCRPPLWCAVPPHHLCSKVTCLLSVTPHQVSTARCSLDRLNQTYGSHILCLSSSEWRFWSSL